MIFIFIKTICQAILLPSLNMSGKNDRLISSSCPEIFTTKGGSI